MRVLIVDDEPVARRGLRVLLERLPDVEVVAEARNVTDAMREVQRVRPDLVLLDVEMPGRDGFELLSQLDAADTPLIIFVTAYSDHAIRAFDAAALDYVLKPIVPERLASAVGRARQILRLRRAELTGTPAPPTHNQNPPRRRVSLRVDGEIRLVSVDEIEMIQSAGNYCCVQLRAGVALIIRETLSAVEARLDPAQFVRAHKSTIVAVRELATIRPLPNRDAVAVLKSGRTLRISRQFRSRVDRLTGSPLG